MNRHTPKTPPVIAITGASAGVGRAVTRRFARDGAKIGLIARGHDGLKAAKTEVDALGGYALATLPTTMHSIRLPRA